MWCIVEIQLAPDPEDEPPSITSVHGPFNEKEDALTHYFGEGTMLRRLADKHPWPDWFPISNQLISVTEMDHPLRIVEGGK